MQNKPDIVPAILVHTQEQLERELEKLRGAPLVQIDLVGENFLRHEDLPLWEDFDFEFDLMTSDSLADAQAAVQDLGASRVVVHIDRPKAREALEFLQPYRTGEFAVAVGAAIACDSSYDALMPFEGLFDYVQVMGIARVGVQGQPFDERALQTIGALRAGHPGLYIQVDGGVKADNFQKILDVGANRLVVGSAYHEVSGK